MLYHTCILGAGAAGLMAAAHLKNQDVLVIDHNEKAAKKLRISGGGRCNITNENVSSQNYLGDKPFIDQVFSRFNNKMLMAYFHDRGLQTSIEKNHQYFCTHSAQDLIDILLNECRHTHFKFHHIIQSIKKGAHFTIETDQGSFKAQHLLIATGGASYAKIGATNIGLQLAAHFSHPTRPFEPALVGLTLQNEQSWMKTLSGISCKATLTIGKKSFTDQLLFAHKGISGPAVLSASLYWKKSSIIIDFLPDYKLKSIFKQKNKKLSSLIPLPKRLTTALLTALELEDKSYSQLNSEETERLSRLKSYQFSPAGNFGLTKAEATRGGVLSEAIDPSTMQSRLVEGLYFAGEVIDVTGELGGYNFQWAFSTAYVAAQALSKP